MVCKKLGMVLMISLLLYSFLPTVTIYGSTIIATVIPCIWYTVCAAVIGVTYNALKESEARKGIEYGYLRYPVTASAVAIHGGLGSSDAPVYPTKVTYGHTTGHMHHRH